MRLYGVNLHYLDWPYYLFHDREREGGESARGGARGRAGAIYKESIPRPWPWRNRSRQIGCAGRAPGAKERREPRHKNNVREIHYAQRWAQAISLFGHYF